MNVPKMVRKNVMMTSDKFHVFIVPRCSWMIAECRNAVAVNHGISPAFSTGSHAQYPPQPSSSYAQRPPRIRPSERNPKQISIHTRTEPSHVFALRPDGQRRL